MRLVHGNRIRAQRTTVDGHAFGSKREANAYGEYALMQRAGLIHGLELHPKWTIEMGGEKICDVIADFRFFDKDQARWRVVDSKQIDTPVSRLKRKMVAAQYGVEIEVM